RSKFPEFPIFPKLTNHLVAISIFKKLILRSLEGSLGVNGLGAVTGKKESQRLFPVDGDKGVG
ncbi:MAG: hypothetical protein ACK43N_24630, partial [Pirellulaceae bacterium]